jgi:hypothetical protein
MNKRNLFLAACLGAMLQAAQAQTILEPEQPQPPGPVYVLVRPSADNPAHFVARARDLLPILERHPVDPRDFRPRILGVELHIYQAISAQGLRVLAEEGGKFDASLRDRMLNCPAKPLPAQLQVLELDASLYHGLTVPVFMDVGGQELKYLQLSLDQPGLPVLLRVKSYAGIALRLTTSPRTRLAGVRLESYYPGVVLGVDPRLVSQQTQRREKPEPCADEKLLAQTRPEPTLPAPVIFKLSDIFDVAIGEPQAVKRRKPTLGNFLDPDMPLPNRHGLVVLASLGYLRPIALAKGKGPQVTHLPTLEILKPFRIPEGLAGGHAVAFFLPDGVEAPSGDLGHSSIVRLAE